MSLILGPPIILFLGPLIVFPLAIRDELRYRDPNRICCLVKYIFFGTKHINKCKCLFVCLMIPVWILTFGLLLIISTIILAIGLVPCYLYSLLGLIQMLAWWTRSKRLEISKITEE